MESDIISKVEAYYTEKVKTFGPTPQGVDWNGKESQETRFEQLSKVFAEEKSGSVLDYGCGYGALLEYLKRNGYEGDYTGFDVSKEMIQEANKIHQSSFVTEIPVHASYDYLIASGIFNVRLDIIDSMWEAYIEERLLQFNSIAQKGFSFNCLTSYSDKPFMRDYLYYASPERLFTFCKKNCSGKVALLHDYPLYEFTIIVRKEA